MPSFIACSLSVASSALFAVSDLMAPVNKSVS